MQRTDRTFCLVVAAALALRLGLLLTSQSGTNGDEAVTGMMAIHIMQGKAMPVYLYGLPYHGGAAITAYLAAPIFCLDEISSFNLKLVPMLFSLAFLIFTYLFCRRFFDARSGLIAALLLLLDPGYLKWNLSPCGSQVIYMLLSILLLYVFYRIYFEGDTRRRSYFLFGFVAGLGLWNLSYMLALAGGLLLLLVLAEGRRFFIRALPLAALGAFLGTLPITLNALFGPEIAADQPFFEMARLSAVPANAWIIVRWRLPALFSPWNAQNVVFPYCWILLASTAACVAYLAWNRRAGLVTMARAMTAFGRCAPQQRDPAARMWPILVFVPAYLALSAVNCVGALQARYLLPIHPPLTILTAVALARLIDGKQRIRLLSAAGIAVFATVGVWVHLDFMLQEAATNEDIIKSGDRRHMRVLRIKNADLHELIEFLRSERIGCVYTAAELRSKIVFESHETILASSRYPLPTAPDEYLTPQRDYYPPHTAAMDRMVGRGERYAVVLRSDMLFCVKASGYPEWPTFWRQHLQEARREGGTYKVKRVGGFVVYYDFKRGAGSEGREKKRESAEGRRERGEERVKAEAAFPSLAKAEALWRVQPS